MRGMTNSCLRWMFQKFNRKYFHSCLPKRFAVRFSDLERNAFGVTRFRTIYVKNKGRKGYKRNTAIGPIEIDNRFKRSRPIVAMTLLHEMVHAAYPDISGHGPRFQRKMLQLAKAGAFNAWW